jgi:H+/Cl- antiporter ClcA
MPYTPLHMGPGMVVKSMAPRHFSIIAFGMTQVLIDLEVLWNMERHNTQLHTFFHTCLGVSLVALIAIPLGKTLSTSVRRIWNYVARYVSSFDMTVPGQTTWTATILGAGIGAYSHVLFDCFYHLDIEPFQPWSDANPFKGLMDPFKMETAFNMLFILGLVWFIIGEILRKRAQRGILLKLKEDKK